jgi:hypothetical protein
VNDGIANPVKAVGDYYFYLRDGFRNVKGRVSTICPIRLEYWKPETLLGPDGSLGKPEWSEGADVRGD